MARLGDPKLPMFRHAGLRSGVAQDVGDSGARERMIPGKERLTVRGRPTTLHFRLCLLDRLLALRFTPAVLPYRQH